MNSTTTASLSNNSERFKIPTDWEPERLFSIELLDEKGAIVFDNGATFDTWSEAAGFFAHRQDATFRARCTYDEYGSDQRFIYEVKAGERTFLYLEAVYNWPHFRCIEQLDTETIMDLRTSIEEVFRRVDVISRDEKGIFINWYPSEVSVVAEYGD